MHFLALILGALSALPFATAAPTPSLSTVKILTTTPLLTHYVPTGQRPSTAPAQHLTVIVGQTLSLDADPLRLQGVEISHISAGETLDMLPRGVQEDDGHVVCEVQGRDREVLREFRIGEKGVLVNEGRVEEVVRVRCWYEADE